jgi:hypothetical protein
LGGNSKDGWIEGAKAIVGMAKDALPAIGSTLKSFKDRAATQTPVQPQSTQAMPPMNTSAFPAWNHKPPPSPGMM